MSSWASQICLVSKKDGGVKSCVDYRKLNKYLKSDGFPLSRIQLNFKAFFQEQRLHSEWEHGPYFEVSAIQE